jgi:very-short-patch-repair endonuclease
VDELVKSIEIASKGVTTVRVELPADLEDLPLLADDARRRLVHFENGGRRGWRFLAPRAVRETRYVEERIRVDGQPPRRAELLNRLVSFLELKSLVAQFFQIWPTPSAFDHSDTRRGARDAVDLVQEFKHIVELFRSPASDSLRVVPVGKRVMLAGPDERRKWLCLIEAETARRRADRAREPLDLWLRALRGFSVDNAHPCTEQFAEAINQRDIAKWRMAWTKREELKTRKQRLDRYQELVDRLERACAGLNKLLTSNWENPEWKHRLVNLDRAWSWSAARGWLRRVSNSDIYRDLGRDRHRLQQKIEKKVEELAALKAWEVFFNRWLDDKTEQHLIAWTRAVARIGQGTGRYAYRHRRTARQYLMACIPKIPAWIMPLHRLWQTTDPKPGVFDTVIVDEASQAGIESLLLLLLAKRIIVVGDDKQNTPEAVGVLEDDIARLARDHLGEFRFRREFRPDTSLFDHADRAFGSLISLREHFRCVPEIIRFSNDLCYTGAPLIPLCQPPPNRIRPLRATFVDTGSCQGEGQRIINYAEADAIVEAVRQCVDDEAYEGKTLGVIVLQGHAQAELIEKKLAEVLEPKVREERKLRCGVPATFQGDERDVIFLSLVVAPDHRSRALTGLDDQRRFNVGMSRARDQVWLFHSVQVHDLSREDLRWKLLNFFYSAGHGALEEAYDELERLQREAKRSPRRPGDQPDPYESWFEVDVALEFLRRKYRVRPQYEVAGYRIDLVLEGLDNRLAVECDGDAWHGPERWEYDIARQRQLERARLTFVRIRESEFYADRGRAVEQVLEACKQLGIWAADTHDEEASVGPTEEEVPNPRRVGTANHGGPEEDDGDLEYEVTSETASTAGFGPFTGYSKECRFPDPREGSFANVRMALGQIVERDGPLMRESVYRLYVEGCPGLQRVGKAVRQALSRALGAMLRSGEILQEDELGGGSLEGLVIRLVGAPTVRERLAGRRDLLEIPPSELFLVLSRLCSSFPETEQNVEALARAVLEHYGFSRLTGKRRRYFTKVLQVWRGRR